MNAFVDFLANLGSLGVYKYEDVSLGDGDNLMEDVHHHNFDGMSSSDKNDRGGTEVAMGTIR